MYGVYITAAAVQAGATRSPPERRLPADPQRARPRLLAARQNSRWLRVRAEYSLLASPSPTVRGCVEKDQGPGNFRPRLLTCEERRKRPLFATKSSRTWPPGAAFAMLAGCVPRCADGSRQVTVRLPVQCSGPGQGRAGHCCRASPLFCLLRGRAVRAMRTAPAIITAADCHAERVPAGQGSRAGRSNRCGMSDGIEGGRTSRPPIVHLPPQPIPSAECASSIFERVPKLTAEPSAVDQRGSDRRFCGGHDGVVSRPETPRGRVGRLGRPPERRSWTRPAG